MMWHGCLGSHAQGRDHLKAPIIQRGVHCRREHGWLLGLPTVSWDAISLVKFAEVTGWILDPEV